MKKVLIIGHFWPYRGGSARMLGLAKYLPEFGWQPIILTGPLKQRPDPKFRFIETNYHGFLGSWVRFLGIKQKEDIGDQLKARFEKTPSKLKYFLKFFYNLIKEIFAYPDEDKNWKKIALEEAENLLKKERIDAIISIWPVTTHLIAKEIKNKYKIPWVADFPDPWSQNHNYPYSFIRKFFDERLEIRTLSGVDAMTAAAPLYKRKQEFFHKRLVILITHGFDPGDLNYIPVELTKKFTITYAGTIYKGKQLPEKIFVVLRKLISEKRINPDDIEIRFFGSFQNWLEEEIKKYNLANIVKQYGMVSRQVSLNKQGESQLLLLLNWEDKKERGVCPFKTFEYLSAKRPILAIGGFPGDDVEKLLVETYAGVYAPTVEEIETALLGFYEEYKRSGIVPYKGNLNEITKYSYCEMAKKFSKILNEMVANK